MRGRPAAWIRLALYILLLGLLLLPWRDVQDHSHWYRVVWVPFRPPVKAFDLVLNVAVFVPLGALVGAAVQRRRRAWTVGLLGALLLASAAEAAQVYSHSRFPSMTDVTANVLGTAVGLWLSTWRRGLSLA